MSRLIRWSSVVMPISGVKGRSFRRVHKIAESDFYRHHVSPFVSLPARMKQLGSLWTEFHEIWYSRISWISVGTVQFDYNLSKKTGTSHEDLRTACLISCWVLLGMTKFSARICRRNQNTRSMFSNLFPKIVLFMKQFGKNMVKPDTPQMRVWYGEKRCMNTECRHTLIIFNTYCFSTASVVSECALLLRCT